MNYNKKRIFIIKEPKDFQSIFEDNGIGYSMNNISQEMSNFLIGKKIIFKEGFFPVSLDGENIKNIFGIQNVSKEINDNNVFSYIKGNYRNTNLSNISFKHEAINITDNIIIENSNFISLELKSTVKTNSFFIKNGTINNLDIVDISYIDFIKVEQVNKIDNLVIKNLTNCNNLNISVLDIINLNIENSFLEGKQFSLQNSKIQYTEFNNVNFGETQFNGIEFINLGFYNTTFNNCTFNNVTFPSELDQSISNIPHIENDKLKDNYRQLKYIMDKNGNHTEANKFYTLEMIYYMKSLNINSNVSINDLFQKKFLGIDSKNISEKLILGLNYLINEFGSNPIRNIFVIISYLLISFITVYLINFSTYLIGIDNIAIGHILGFLLYVLLLFLVLKLEKTSVKTKELLNNKKLEKFMLILFIISTTILLMDGNIVRFYGIHTFTYLINPFSGLTYNAMNELLWSEQIGLIIHKIIYGTLIYQLIVALKRTTKR